MNRAWADAFVEGLAQAGVSRAVVCPGARSAPLAMALARCSAIDTIPVLDERSAAFIGLGVGKAGRGPAVILCTSGSAGAHMLPAVIEADAAGVPLLIVTADRPPEARDGLHRQTTEQLSFFAGRSRKTVVLGCPSDVEDSWPGVAARQAVEATIGDLPGPVHVNAPFREPLGPSHG
jgi:2-succinyl-5-enolpyruvyl-6-hydroxy-3-cyclohexene-1-carboxylate synthase